MNIKCRLHQGRSDKGSRARKVGGRASLIKCQLHLLWPDVSFLLSLPPLPNLFHFFHFLLYIWSSCRCAAPKPLSSLSLLLPSLCLCQYPPLPPSLCFFCLLFFGDLQPLCYGPKWWWMRLGLVAKLATGTGTATGHAASGSVAVAVATTATACACASATVATAFRLPWPGLMPAAMYNNNSNNSGTQCQKKNCNSENFEGFMSAR